MNKINTLLVFLLFMVVCVGANAQGDEKITIALLGTFHFAGSNDLMSMKFDDLRSEKRQAEIVEMVDMLKEFQPTKVILEFPYGNNKLDSVYQLYLSGERKLSINERQQLGFRLAEGMGHEHIYVADHPMDLPFNELMSFLEMEGRIPEFQQLLTQTRQEVIQKHEEYFSEHSVSEYFRILNGEESDNRNKNFYLEKASAYNSEDNDIGIRLVSSWWERNFRIMAHIDRIAEEGDRLLVLFGQGHTAILKDLYRDRDDVDYVEIIEFLN